MLEGGSELLVKVEDIQALGCWTILKMRGGRERMGGYDLKHILKLHEALYTKVMEGVRDVDQLSNNKSYKTVR